MSERKLFNASIDSQNQKAVPSLQLVSSYIILLVMPILLVILILSVMLMFLVILYR